MRDITKTMHYTNNYYSMYRIVRGVVDVCFTVSRCNGREFKTHS